LLVHPFIGQATEKNLVGGVVGIDGYADAAGDRESMPGNVEGFLEGLGYALEAANGDEVWRQIAGEIVGDNDELVAAEAGESVGRADGVAKAAGDVL